MGILSPYLSFYYSIYIFRNSFLNLSSTYRSKVSAHCSRKKKGKLKRRDEGAIGCKYPSMATIYFLNYKDAVAEAWRRWRVYYEQPTRVWKKRAGKSWKLSEIEHDFFEKRSPAPLWDYEPSPSSLLPSRLFLRYIRREFCSPLHSHYFWHPQNFTRKKIVCKFVRKSRGVF